MAGLAQLDFGGLTALSGVDNWAEKRAGYERDAQRIAILNAYAQQNNQKQQAAAADIQDHINTISKIKVLDQDKARIQDKEKELYSTIQDGIKKSHGNLDKYLNSGGKTALMQYRNSLLESDEVQRGLLNAFNHNMATADQQKGLVARPTSWMEGGKNKAGTISENLEAFQSGKTNEFNYSGGYEQPTGDPAKYFSEQLSTPTKEEPEIGVRRPRIATARDVFDYYLNVPKGKGMNEQDRVAFATQKAQQYAVEHGPDGSKGGYQYKFEPEKVDYARRNAIKEIQANERLKLQQEKVTKGFSADPFDEIHSGKIGTPEQITPNAHAYMDVFGLKPDAGVAEDATVPIKTANVQLSEQAKSAEAKYIGNLKYDKKAGGWVGTINNADKIVDPHTLQKAQSSLNDIPGIVIKDITGVRTLAAPNGQIKSFAVARVKFKNQRQMDDFGAINHHYLFPSSKTGAWQQDVDFDNNEVTVMIPVDAPQLNPLGHIQYNTELKKYGALQQEAQQDPFLEDAVISDSRQ